MEMRVKRAVARRRIFPYLVGVTAALGVLAGFLVTLVDRRDFPTFGDGVWWAIVTLGTVGYGDIVPRTAWGRVIGSIVIVVGVTFISFMTAMITSYFVSSDQEQAEVREREERAADVAETIELLRGIERRLDAIEAKLDE